MSPDRRRLFSWENHAQQHPPQEARQQGGSQLEQHLYEIGVKIGEVLSKVDGQTAEAKAIRRAIDGLASELRDELNEQEEVIATQSDRIAAIERHLAAQEAEARGIRRALGWGATILSGAGVLLGWFLSKFGKKPMHIFGFLGSLMFLIGFIAVVAVGVSKLYALRHGQPYILVTDSPYFYIALTMMLLGTQLFLAGFVSELVVRNAPERNNYKIEKEL